MTNLPLTPALFPQWEREFARREQGTGVRQPRWAGGALETGVDSPGDLPGPWAGERGRLNGDGSEDENNQNERDPQGDDDCQYTANDASRELEKKAGDHKSDGHDHQDADNRQYQIHG